MWFIHLLHLDRLTALTLYCYMKKIPPAKPFFFMGSFSLQAEATSPTLVHVFVKATTTPSPCFPPQRGCAGLCGTSQGHWGRAAWGLGCLSVPTCARGGGCSMSLRSRDTLYVQYKPELGSLPPPCTQLSCVPWLSAVTWAEPAQQSCRVSPWAACHQLLLPGDNDAFSRHVSFLCLWYLLD